ncbi:Zinc finger, RING-CH-type [Artemisia annua]|uniref:Zinc finger, RING-CH-type n=1 Tax=Artemisia annua TaxID=35608 RepID=A0A2U1MP66_ARTAN|nr:Zinc finger, RING-CH-type [Artemisia annua]
MALSSSETKDEDLEVGLIATCRICYQCDDEEDGDLISPCMCKGSQQFVHRSCLDHWRSIKEGFDFSHCTTCKAQFHLQVVELEENVWRKIKISLFIARDVIFALLVLQTVFGMLGGIAYLGDKHEYLRDLLKDYFYTIVIYYGIGVIVFFVLLGSMVFIVGYCLLDDNGRINCCAHCEMDPLLWFVVALLFCVVVLPGSFGIGCALQGAITLIQWITNRHNSILAKKELTKEYVVEDLHGCYTPAELDPEHMERLKALKLF